MSRERAAKAVSLRQIALQYERGDLDADLKNAAQPVAVMRATVVRRLREIADRLDAGSA